MDESHNERLARIDENVKHLLHTLPLIQKLDKESEVNKREHKIAITIFSMILFPFIVWFCKRVGIVFPE